MTLNNSERSNTISNQQDHKTYHDVGTQTSEYYTSYKSSVPLFSWSHVHDLIDILIDSCSDWSSIQTRVLSLMVYFIVSIFNIKYEEKRSILQDLNLINIKTCQSWICTILEEDDLCVILRDNRGTHKRNNFYELFPDIEKQAQLYALENASKKDSSFTVDSLAQHISKIFKIQYNELYETLVNKDGLIRSNESCRVDLLRWGAKWDSNKNRPYFEGHEREDVVLSRIKFTEHFLENKRLFYQTKRNEDGCPIFEIPRSMTQKHRILIAHDESTYRSGELPNKRWLFPDLMPFYNKGNFNLWSYVYFF